MTLKDLPKIKAYTLSTCPHCNAMKKFMEENDVSIEYIEVDLLHGGERDEVLAEVNKICPYCGYPVIVIGDVVIEGHNPSRIMEVLGI